MNADFTRGHLIVSSHSLCVSKLKRTSGSPSCHSTLDPSLRRVNQTAEEHAEIMAKAGRLKREPESG
jgi:hypothetical protein